MELDESHLSDKFEITETDFPPFFKEKANLISSMLEGIKVIEVGCGTGDLLRYLDYTNLDLTGSDYSNVYLNKAKERNLPVKLFKADLLDEKFWLNYENQFDSVIASEVIEHIENDLKALKTICQILKPGGILIITVPAFNFIYSEYDKKIGHFRRYTKQSITKKVEEAGFSVEKIRYWNFIGFFGWLVSFKILKKSVKSSVKSYLINILADWLKIERSIEMPFGLTVVVKARKKPTNNP